MEKTDRDGRFVKTDEGQYRYTAGDHDERAGKKRGNNLIPKKKKRKRL